MSDDGDERIGEVIGGRYEILRRLGKGGMGELYVVKHVELNREFALKTLSAWIARDREALARFRREADVVASLRHRNVVDIVDWAYLADGAPCIVMELLKGEDLGQRLTRGGALRWPVLARIADEVLSALSVAHRADIVHRDLKPQNIFLAQDDSGAVEAKLLDFGVSKIRNSLLTLPGQAFGTPLYMSPEQADGRSDEIGPATDVFAMGAVLYEMATGRAAFSQDTAQLVIYQILNGEPAPLARLRSDAPPAFLAVVKKALAKRIGERFPDAGAMRTVLADALRKVAPGALPTPLIAELSLAEPVAQEPRANATVDPSDSQAPTRPRRGSRGNRLVAVVAGTALVAATAGMLLFRLLGAPPPSAAPSPPVAAAPPPVVAAPPPAAEVTIPIRRHPTGASVLLDGVEVSGDEVRVKSDGKFHELRARARGYVDDVRMIDAHSTSPIDLRLAPVPIASARPKHKPAAKPQVAAPKPPTVKPAPTGHELLKPGFDDGPR